ncbi:MAG: ABC transporter permease [Ardenticatenaceae bacterium]
MSKAEYFLRRLGLGVFVLVGVLVITFVVSRMIPADPTVLFAGPRSSPEVRARIRAELGLDDPIPVQFVRYTTGVLQGDLGMSFRSKRPIIEDLKVFLPATLELVIPTILLSIVIGVPLGIYGAAGRGGKFDQFGRLITVAGVSMPAFWLGLLLQLCFGLWLEWLPLSGRISREITISNPIETITGFYLIDAAVGSNWEAWWDALRHMILPVFVLATYPIALVSRMTRTSMIEVLSEQYVTAARAAGVSKNMILFRLALKNALIPTLTVLGLVFAFSITGSVLIEVVFQWPGLGKYITDAIISVDFPVIMAVTLIVAIIYIVINLVVDLAQASLDPRIRLD